MFGRLTFTMFIFCVLVCSKSNAQTQVDDDVSFYRLKPEQIKFKVVNTKNINSIIQNQNLNLVNGNLKDIKEIDKRGQAYCIFDADSDLEWNNIKNDEILNTFKMSIFPDAILNYQLVVFELRSNSGKAVVFNCASRLHPEMSIGEVKNALRGTLEISVNRK